MTLKIITAKDTELNWHDIMLKSQVVSSLINGKKQVFAVCCWSQKKIDYIYCYEAARLLNIPFIPLPASIEFGVLTSLINSLPFSVAVYKDGQIDVFTQSHDDSVSDWLAVAELCFFTSGSTGEKKLVFLSSENVNAAVLSIQERLDYCHEDRVVNFLPMAFDYGFYQYLLTKNADATLCLVDEGLSMASVSHIDSVQISVLPLVPSMVTALLSMAGRRFNGSSVKKITSTGESISSGLITQVTDLFNNAKFYTMYGLTECKRVSILLPEEAPNIKESVGRAISCAKVVIDNPDAQGVGEIIVSGKNVALGVLAFASSGEVSRIDFNGVLNTGDLGSIDNDGFLYIAGRRDAQIKILGQRTNPIEIENAALSVPGVKTCKASADGLGCYLQCIVEEQITPQYIRQSLLKRLGTIASKITISIVTHLDWTANYKSKRPE
ncbi:hypothetical protein BHU62_21370 [Serratia marcescens]|uniref:AMP-dependent synthetase/ligase domain-containing protein n=1 Tax=Serratia marcescens TaxID=615 RepID=A0A1Q4NV00_SERMA|nr:AMP-binding protein [Serratia marcescens]OKB64691.1 hypothetical protein BHU62_21370 [Serratia marcescens]